MTKIFGMALVLILGCGKSSEPAQRQSPEQSPPAAAPVSKPEAPATTRLPPSQEQERCAVLAATYQAERNNLFGEDRATLRERLSNLGDQYRTKMNEIPGCTFSLP